MHSLRLTPRPAALIGLGRWGGVLRRKLCAPRSPFTLTATHDAAPHAPQSHTLAQVLRDPTLTAAFIAVPPHAHHAIASALLDAGKHVWLEKPCGASLEELEDLIARAERRGVALHLGYTYLHNPLALELSARARALAPPSAARPWQISATRLQAAPPGARALRAPEALYDLMVHDLSLLKMVAPHLRAEEIDLSARALSGAVEGEGLALTLRAPHLAAHLTAGALAPAQVRRFALSVGDAHLTLGLLTSPPAPDAHPHAPSHPAREALWVGALTPPQTLSPTAPDPLDHALSAFALNIARAERGGGLDARGVEVGRSFHALAERVSTSLS